MEFARDKTVVITGASDGIGKAAALKLVKAGAKVVLHGRDSNKTSRVADWIFDQTGRRVLDTLIADFSSLAEVRKFADDLCGLEADVQILINNAGVYSDRRILTQDGYEFTFQVNHLAPFLLTLLLEPLLKKNKPARVINVTSTLHIDASFDMGSFEDYLHGEKPYDGYSAYGTSKLALSAFSVELAKRWQGSNISVFHVHPGGVSTKLLHAGFGPGGMPVGKGADPIVRLATLPDRQTRSGLYFSRMEVGEPDPRVNDSALREKLWELTWTAVGLDEKMKERAGMAC